MANQPENQNLRALIRNNLKGRTYAELARDCGFNNRATVQRLATKDPVDFPSTETLLGLAQGLRVPAGAVVAATAVSVGLDPNPYGSMDLVISKAKTLPKESQDMLTSMSEQLLWWHEQYERRIDEVEDKLANVTDELEGTKNQQEMTVSELSIANEYVKKLEAKLKEKVDGPRNQDWLAAADTTGSKGEGGEIKHDDLPHTT